MEQDLNLPEGFIIDELPQGFVLDNTVLSPEQAANYTPAQTPQSNMAAAGYRGIEQGATLGFGDELKALLGAGVAKTFGGQLTSDIPYSELYNQSLQNQTQQLKQDYKTQPAATIIGNIGGGAVGLGGAAGLKALAKIAPTTAKALVTSNSFLGARAKDAIQGFVTGGIAGVGTSNENRVAGGILGAATGGVLSPVVGGVMSAVTKKVNPIDNYITQKMSEIKPIRVSSADLGDQEAQSVFNLAKTGKLGQEASQLATEFTDAQSRDFADNFLSLYKGDKLTNEQLGEGLSKRLLDAANNAKAAKDIAYKNATPAMKQAYIDKGNLIPLVQDLRTSIKDFDPEIVPTVKGISKNIDTLESLIGNSDVKNIKLNALEVLRKRFNNLPVTDASSSSVVSGAKGALDKFSNDLFEQGLIQGDVNALNLIKEARQAHSYWKQNFDGKSANNIIKKYIASEGENLTSDQLLNKFTTMNEAGLNGIQAAKEILGSNATPIIRQGILNKVYNTSITKQPQLSPTGQILTDGDGLPLYNDIIQPEKLASSIEKIFKDKAFLREAGFAQKDLLVLKQLQAVAKQISSPIDKTNPSGSGNKIIDFIKQQPLLQTIFKLPAIGDIAEAIANKSSANKIKAITQGKSLQSPTLASTFKSIGNTNLTAKALQNYE